MNLSDESFELTPTGKESQLGSSSKESSGSMQEFYQLSQELLLVTLTLTGIIFISVWIFYNLNTALNYLIGACTGVLYLRMLGRDVEQLGSEKQLSKNRLALFVVLIVVATQLHQLQVLPIFLGFLTYKATLLVYMIRTLMPPDPQS